MPNLINTDSAGNVFLDYVTPLEQGAVVTSSSGQPDGYYDSLFEAKLGASGTNWIRNSSDTYFRLDAPLEMKTGAVSSTGFARFRFRARTPYVYLNSNNADSNTFNIVAARNDPNAHVCDNPHKVFAVINDHAFCTAVFNVDLTVCSRFVYLGWLREPTITNTASLCALSFDSRGSGYVRPATFNTTIASNLSTAADTITSPPIVCTTGTDPGDGSETFTDIVIRDADSPNNPVGKLWNCIDLPATATVGGLYKNVGAYDGDNSASEQDVYLCVMPWGTRKLGMRVWTENV